MTNIDWRTPGRRGLLLGIAGGLASSMAGSLPARAQSSSSVIAETTEGRIRGVRVGDVASFKGVYYAGEANRFMPAPAPAKWAGIRDATAFGPISPQGGDEPNRAGNGVDEHCQVLNVWTTGPDHRRRPVLVWLHGGGFQFGSANSPEYDGHFLALARDTVVVSVNHRLGVLGAVWLSDDDRRYASSGAVGMLDIVQALRWVNGNISAFGGDPESVTIFGQSGGGGKVLTLMTMPAATGLFHRAIVESGSMRQTSATKVQGQAQTRRLLDSLNLDANAALQLATAPLSAVMAAQAKLDAEGPRRADQPDLPQVPGLRPFSPIIDGVVLPQQPFGVRAPEASRSVPMTIGSTTQELRRFSLSQPALFTLDQDSLRTRLHNLLGDRADEAIDVYARARPGATPSGLYWAITADEMYWRHSVRVAELKSAQDGRVYMYRFAYDPNEGQPYAGPTLGPGHAAEIPYVFAQSTERPVSLSPTSRLLSKQMSGAWADFARTGRAGAALLPTWPRYSPPKRATMIFDASPHVAFDPETSERQWWERHREPA